MSLRPHSNSPAARSGLPAVLAGFRSLAKLATPAFNPYKFLSSPLSSVPDYKYPLLRRQATSAPQPRYSIRCTIDGHRIVAISRLSRYSDHFRRNLHEHP
jgi:hypothetical protein